MCEDTQDDHDGVDGLELRDVLTVWRDGLWPRQGGFSPDPNVNYRYLAVAEVLSRIPEEDYQDLVRKCQRCEFEWFIPEAWHRAGVFPFPALVEEIDPASEEGRMWPGENRTRVQAVVLFLGPQLERARWDVIVGIVAHELAHLALGHQLYNTTEIYEFQEEECWRRVAEWGFQAETRKVLAVNKWYDAYDDYLTRRLKAAELTEQV